MAERPGFFARLADKATPTREEVLESRWLKPFGKRIRQSDLWRFTRRSVPSGVFAGLFIGIFLMIPGLQIVGAALLSVPLLCVGSMVSSGVRPLQTTTGPTRLRVL